MIKRFVPMMALVGALTAPTANADDHKFDYKDVFNLEYATGAQAAPDGKSVVYERRAFDIQTDSTRINIWSVDIDGSNHRPVLSGKAQYRMPRFSTDGSRMAYVSSLEGKTQIYVRWLDTGETARVTDLEHAPGAIEWSPDGSQIAFTMFVPESQKPLFTMPPKPKGAKWAGNAKVVDRTLYRFDGAGYLPRGFTHIFTVPADGGTPRQITSGSFNHGGPITWTKDGAALIFSANRNADWATDVLESEVYRVNISDGAINQLTNRKGPDASPAISPNGDMIAYTGNDDNGLSSQNAGLYVMNIDGSNSRRLVPDIDRSIGNVQWAADGQGLFYAYDNEGRTTIAYVTLTGAGRAITQDVGGTTLGRPYTSGDYRAMPDGQVVFTLNDTGRPADLAVINRIGRVEKLTNLNEDLLGHKEMASVEEITLKSSIDGRDLQAWIAKPPGFDPSKKYPLLLEIHGGPHTAYGPVYSTEIQLYAAQGYVVVYGNPRGSTSYGAEFANLIHQNYPSQDYDDLMDMVNATINQGYIDEDQLYVTGGSGGGVLTAWIIGKTNRFRAAVVAKPVINWTSFALTADIYPLVTKYWFDGAPWENQEDYWKRSPLSLVGNVETPTMLLTGEDDQRTPIPETEQYYQALKLRGIDSVMVRIPGSSHTIAAKPSNLIQKVGNIVAWFKKHENAD